MGYDRLHGTASLSEAWESLQQLIADVRSQPRSPVQWQPFPNLEPFLRQCDPVAQMLADARRSVTRIDLDDRGDRI
jgi:hypothetical protein